MSWGTVLCSVCKVEVHQNGPKNENGRIGWTHDTGQGFWTPGTPICEGATAIYPDDAQEAK